MDTCRNFKHSQRQNSAFYILDIKRKNKTGLYIKKYGHMLQF
jgi:hypothetical protein